MCHNKFKSFPGDRYPIWDIYHRFLEEMDKIYPLNNGNDKNDEKNINHQIIIHKMMLLVKHRVSIHIYYFFA